MGTSGAFGEKKRRDWPADAQQRVLIAGLVGEWQSLLSPYRKGVVLCERYRMNSLYFKGLIEREFAHMFRDSNKGGSKLFVQNGDPSQNSGLACVAWNSIGAALMPIQPTSRDINCIENIFHIIKTLCMMMH